MSARSRNHLELQKLIGRIQSQQDVRLGEFLSLFPLSLNMFLRAVVYFFGYRWYLKRYLYAD